jgi:ribosomal protein S6--L-glutamate ligase
MSRGDFVRLVNSRQDLVAILPDWGDLPVVAQQFADNDVFDIKVWVIGHDVSAARRRAVRWTPPTEPSTSRWTPPSSRRNGCRLCATPGAALRLQLYGSTC